jgi:Concanavalin A-like lectin/glucanases superfamily
MFDAPRFGMKALPKILLALTGVAALSLAYPASVQAVPTTATATATSIPTATAGPTSSPGDFAAVILATEPANLRGYWKCNETSGRTLADSSGNSKHLTIIGAINTNYWLGESGEQGTCFRTDGVAGYASRNDAVIPSLDNTNFTLFALFKGGTDFNAGAAVAITTSTTERNHTFMGGDRVNATSRASAKARGNSTVIANNILGGTAFDGNWHSVAWRRNGTAFDLFVDGARVASTTATLATGGVPPNRTSLMHALLFSNPPATYARGSIQHAAIWNTALSDSEIMAIQAARNIHPEPTTYQYTGNHFIDVAGPGYTTGMSVTGMVTLANPLPPNFGGAVTPTSFTFFDGVQTLTGANTAEFDIRFVTDATGNIIGWSVELIGQCSAYTPMSIGTRNLASSPPPSDKGIFSDVDRGVLSWARVLRFPGYWSGPLATGPDAGTTP